MNTNTSQIGLLLLAFVLSTIVQGQEAKPAGFGEQKSSSQPSGFGTTPPPSAASSNRGGTKATFTDDKAAFARAKQLIEEHGGKDGTLPRFKLRGLIDPKQFKSKLVDPNDDAEVSAEELAAVLRAGITVASAQKAAPPRTPAKSEKPTPIAQPASGKKSYRFLPGKERLPEKIPTWFISKDRDGDGQVAMAEYSSRWSDRDAEAFARYDANGDGFITPDEAK